MEINLIGVLEIQGEWSIHDSGIIDNDYKTYYYYNRIHNISSWYPPRNIYFKILNQNISNEKDYSSSIIESFENWSSHDSGHGAIYYYNSHLKASFWKKPMEWIIHEQNQLESIRIQNLQEEINNREKALEEKVKMKIESKKIDDEKLKFEEKNNEENSKKVTNTNDTFDDSIRIEENDVKTINEFIQLLKEKKIMPFSKWINALPLIAIDPRFSAIKTMDERKVLFNHFTKNAHSDLVKQERKDKLKKEIQKFKEFIQNYFVTNNLVDRNISLTFMLEEIKINQLEIYNCIKDNVLDLIPLKKQEKIFSKQLKKHMLEVKEDPIKKKQDYKTDQREKLKKDIHNDTSKKICKEKTTDHVKNEEIYDEKTKRLKENYTKRSRSRSYKRNYNDSYNKINKRSIDRKRKKRYRSNSRSRSNLNKKRRKRTDRAKDNLIEMMKETKSIKKYTIDDFEEIDDLLMKKYKREYDYTCDELDHDERKYIYNKYINK